MKNEKTQLTRNLIVKDIILKKCNERESRGYDYLNDSDVMDIIEECEQAGYPITREELKLLGLE